MGITSRSSRCTLPLREFGEQEAEEADGGSGREEAEEEEEEKAEGEEVEEEEEGFFCERSSRSVERN